MAGKFVWGTLGGVVPGAPFGYVGGNTGICIAICMATGAIDAGIWHHVETRQVR